MRRESHPCAGSTQDSVSLRDGLSTVTEKQSSLDSGVLVLKDLRIPTESFRVVSQGSAKGNGPVARTALLSAQSLD